MEFKYITKDDIGPIIDLTLEHLTNGDYISKEISRAVEEGNYYGVKAVENGVLAGFNTYKRGIEFTLPHPELTEVISKLAPEESVFNGDAFYVDQRFRRKGIGRELTFRARDHMMALGGRYFLGELWVYPDGIIPASTPNSYYGDTVFERLVPFFYRDLPRYGMRCPICGEDCRCSAVVRLARFKGDKE
jgi:GNAT superfamily N-acetyltransferase